MFTRVLVANRGEIAVRVIRALHELGIEAVAVYSTADARRAARAARRRGRLRRARRRRPRATCASRRSSPPPSRPAARPCIPATASSSENPAFVEACVDNDLVFVGPPADVMATMGDKIAARIAMRAADVPTVPGHRRRDDASRGARAAADEIGYPVLLKAAAGGGGKGMRLVDVAGRARGRVRRRRGRGRRGVRRRDALRREGARARRGTSRSRCSATATATC